MLSQISSKIIPLDGPLTESKRLLSSWLNVRSRDKVLFGKGEPTFFWLLIDIRSSFFYFAVRLVNADAFLMPQSGRHTYTVLPAWKVQTNTPGIYERFWDIVFAGDVLLTSLQMLVGGETLFGLAVAFTVLSIRFLNWFFKLILGTDTDQDNDDPPGDFSRPHDTSPRPGEYEDFRAQDDPDSTHSSAL